MRDAPCYFCKSRLIGCHAQCDKWSIWREIKDKQNDTIREVKANEGMIINYKKAVYQGINKRMQG